ncbi:hypothetical protein BX661DRAFT_167861 [Kickxella alabastrina]|uniref:uncharacterized protein n=1 Tax=Kickxella alabastrina TaxID=61397 RepID=UPI00221E9A4A|nr:uncharacterized protein BX661DRAFT_167861 [Kickxella alabastrina]KAI7834626.1 hypothetical protein BX661DRAFT_167861 [Kickxella alabastrina]
MSLIEILGICFGGNSAPSRQASYLSADEASNMPLDAFLQRSLESAPSALEQNGAFADIFQKHIQGGADAAKIVRIVQDVLARLAGNDTDRATTQWACQVLAPANAGHQLRPAAGTDNNGWQTQESKQRPQQQKKSGDDDVYIRSYFFPSEDSFNALINFIEAAKSTLDICVFNITDNDIARAIGDAKKRGVNVRIITDDEQLKCQGNDVERMREQYGIPFKTDSDPSKFMHSKFAIIDRRAIWTGSYNWTVSARRSNNESAICTNDPNTAKAYSQEFETLWKQF